MILELLLLLFYFFSLNLIVACGKYKNKLQLEILVAMVLLPNVVFNVKFSRTSASYAKLSARELFATDAK